MAHLSFGAWTKSSSSPNPKTVVSIPKCFLNMAMAGIEAPSRMYSGLLPNTSSNTCN